jgi:hypothetical protein
MKGWAIALLIVAMTGYLAQGIEQDAESNIAASCLYQ